MLSMQTRQRVRRPRSGSHGMSRIVSPTGHILAEACPDKEELLVHRLTLTEAHRAHALESLRDSYFLKDWYISGVRSLFEATIPPESPHIRGHGVPGIPRSSSRGGRRAVPLLDPLVSVEVVHSGDSGVEVCRWWAAPSATHHGGGHQCPHKAGRQPAHRTYHCTNAPDRHAAH